MSITKVCTKCGVDKALTEFYAKKTAGDGRVSSCKECCKAQQNQYREENKETVKASQLRFRRDNQDKVSAWGREYYSKNKERIREAQSKYQDDNREELYKMNKKYRQSTEGKAVRNALGAKRRAQKLQATPAWADQDAIKAIYAEAQRLQETLGIEFHIDHIVPLQGELVCGLHVESNLQVIPAILNLKKSNKFKVQ
tara:strand:+ start:54 stop:644 length:591 start_codon:yes stop_codon:yes gene_type:complete